MHGACDGICEKSKRRAASPLAVIARSSQRMLNPAAHSTAQHRTAQHRMQRVTAAAAQPAAVHPVVALGMTDGRRDGLAPLEPASLLHIQ